MDYSSPGSSLHGIPQATILEWVTISLSRGSCQLRDWTLLSCNAQRFLTIWAATNTTGKSFHFFSVHQFSCGVFFCLHHATCGILASWSSIQPGPWIEKFPSPNHWTTQESPVFCVLRESFTTFFLNPRSCSSPENPRDVRPGLTVSLCVPKPQVSWVSGWCTLGVDRWKN